MKFISILFYFVVHYDSVLLARSFRASIQGIPRNACHYLYNATPSRTANIPVANAKNNAINT